VYGFEGANVLFDTWVHPLVMGLEEHLLQMFREDFEFHDGAVPSHLAAVAPSAPAAGGAVPAPAGEAEGVRTLASVPQLQVTVAMPAVTDPAAAAAPAASAGPVPPVWTPEGEQELRKIPFFVRGKAKRNTEAYAAQHGIARIGVDTLYDAKAHFGR
jgi:light-independent protochlorophyllide reductase subunit B